MKAIIYVFTGTGNTLRIAELYKKNLSSYETEIYKIRMKRNSEYKKSKNHQKKFIFEPFPNPNTADLVGFAFPIHGFNPPKGVMDFCKQLPICTPQKSSFIIKVGGEGLHFNDYAGQKLMRVMEKRGYKFLSDRLYVMPYNMIFRHSPEMVKTEWIYADAQARLHCKMLLEKKQTKVFLPRLKSWFVPIFRIEHIYAKVQGPFMSVNMKKCIQCMKCVKNCPMNNIRFENGKFKFGTNCALCVCCSFGCPKDAISIGLLNGWRINGDYQIQKTANDSSIKFPSFSDSDCGLKRHAYRNYFKRLEHDLENADIDLQLH